MQERGCQRFNSARTSQVWHSALLDDKSVLNDTISLPVPQGCVSPAAVRYLWYDTPCGNAPFLCPIYTAVELLGGLSGEREYLPLGPFVAAVAKTDDDAEIASTPTSAAAPGILALLERDQQGKMSPFLASHSGGAAGH